MKYLFLFIFLASFFLGFTQETHKNVLVKEDTVSYSAREKVLQKKIKDALKAKDYELADDYLSQLKKLNKFKSEINLFKNGFYVDALSGIGLIPIRNNNAPNTLSVAIGLSFRFGNKWFFKGKEKQKTAFNLIYLRPVFYLTPRSNANLVSNSILNIGISHLSLFKNLTSGFEFNINTGYNILSDIQSSSLVLHGFNLNPNIKLKYKKLSYGLDLLSTFYFLQKDALVINLISFNFGAKF